MDAITRQQQIEQNNIVSIHAPVMDAMYRLYDGSGLILFQSTRP